MSIYVQYRYGTTTEHNTFTGGAQEITVDTTKNTLVVHNGSTVGGFPLMRQDLNNAVAYNAANKNVLPAATAGTFAPLDQQVLNADGTWRTQLATIRTVSASGNYDLVAADAESYIRFTHASGTKLLRIPTNASVAFPIGTTISGISTGTGTMSIAAITPATTRINIESGTSTTIALRTATYVGFVLTKVATDQWDLVGDLN